MADQAAADGRPIAVAGRRLASQDLRNLDPARPHGAQDAAFSLAFLLIHLSCSSWPGARPEQAGDRAR